ncbi:MAG: hypothetical protein H6745_01395 [Deltaproteobacteria bacterium]|nr:hypothetical protein [Deltaproteobacteria bacterium]
MMIPHAPIRARCWLALAALAILPGGCLVDVDAAREGDRDAAAADTASVEDTVSSALDGDGAAEDTAPVIPEGCPTPVITSTTPVGAVLAVPASVVLDGAASVPGADGRDIVAYHWEVVRAPDACGPIVLPSLANQANLRAATVGTYEVRLTVDDGGGATGCPDARFAFTMVPNSEGIAVELTWETPGDPDPTDVGPETGADLDLHLLHEFATGGYDGDGDGELDGWFDSQFDCFWHNSKPNWGSVDPLADDDPELVADETIGCGPEVITFATPEDGKTYRIGVHYWDDHGFGRSTAKIRVWVRGELVFEQARELIDKDLWFVARLAWPSGELTRVRGCGGTPTPCETDAECQGGEACTDRVAPAYVHPLYSNSN